MGAEHDVRARADIPVTVAADVIEDGFGMIREPGGPPLVVAVLHDGTPTANSEAETHAELLQAAPAMLELLQEALEAWDTEFDGDRDPDLDLSPSDLVDWFTEGRDGVRQRLRQYLPPALI